MFRPLNHKASRLFLGLLLILKGCTGNPGFHENLDPGQTLLLISWDGFAFDYQEKAFTPNLDSLVAHGVKAQALEPVFPTKTFPNHYTQVTGLYPENHGIISNRMYDPSFKEFFSIGDASARDGKWYGGEPIWVTAQKQGLKSATMFWPGSDAEINGYYPTFYYPFNGAVSAQARVKQVLDWMGMAQERPQLITLYFESIDKAGHNDGPDSQKIVDEIENLDQLLGDLLDGIRDMGIIGKINVILISDHGMTSVSREKVIFLDDYIDLSQFEVVNWSPVMELIPISGSGDAEVATLQNAHPNLMVYTSETLPEVLHFKHNPRITPIVGIADIGWSVSSREYFLQNPEAYSGGAHGYLPFEEAMKGIFISCGPAFKSGARLGAVSSIHLYELMCFILGIIPEENNGRLDVWKEALMPG